MKRKYSEILDKRFKDIQWNRKGGAIFFKFTVKASEEYNPNNVDIIYTVKFSKPSPVILTCDRPGIEGRLKVKTTTLMFWNNLTQMSTLSSKGYQDINSSLLFSSVAKVVIEYFERKMSSAQAVTFVPAHQKLRKPYKILSKEAEKRGNLVWINPNSGGFELVTREIFDQYKRRKEEE